MTIPKGYLEEVLGISLRARPYRETREANEPFNNPIIHKQIHGDKVYVPLNREFWSN
jgi:hypothetical protein